MSTPADAILWLLRVQGDYAYKMECIRILNVMYEYWQMLKVYFGLKVLGMAAFAITKTKWFKDLKEKVEEKTKIGR